MAIFIPPSITPGTTTATQAVMNIGLQKIVDTSTRINFDRRRVVGQSISRSQRIKTAERASAQPWKLTISPAPIFDYTSARPYIEAIMLADRNTEVKVNLGKNTRMNYLTAYQGAMTSAQLSALTVTNFTNTSMTIGGLPSVAATRVMFQAGDFIQPFWSRYPYVVTEQVLRGTGTNIVVNTNRPRITSEATTVTGTLLVGTQTSFTCVITQLPTYELSQWQRVNFSGDFELVEKIV
jgi:hypothetical protein